LRAAFGPVIDRLAANNIDLTKMPVEVAPIAHYHMGGIVTDVQMQTELPGLFAAGEVVGGANGANRLSGNAITEALVFGRRAGRSAADFANRMRVQPASADAAYPAVDLVLATAPKRDFNTAEAVQTLQTTMQDDVGALRNASGLSRALNAIDRLTSELGDIPPGDGGRFDMQRVDWFDLRNMLLVARVVAEAALTRTETRGAQQRDDHPRMAPAWAVNQYIGLRDGRIALSTPPRRAAVVAL
jgi:succinate dehydrogenase / fumarate reductase flavoprotein subunit